LAIVAGCLAGAFTGTLFFDLLGVFWIAILGLACIGFLIAAGDHYLTVMRPAELEMSAYIMAAGQYVAANRDELVAMCSIDGLFWRNQYTNDEPYYATREHILFLIEPGRAEFIAGDFEQKLQWMRDDPARGGAIYAAGGVMTRVWR
jgi:hypothetical protein